MKYNPAVMPTTVELAQDVEQAVLAEARRRGVDADVVVNELLRKDTPRPVDRVEANRLTLRTFKSGSPAAADLPADFVDNIRDFAYDDER
jgi:hypothetical protein